jgi:hypothetical protein
MLDAFMNLIALAIVVLTIMHITGWGVYGE